MSTDGVEVRYEANVERMTDGLAEAIRSLADTAKQAGVAIQDIVVALKCEGECKTRIRRAVQWTEFYEGRVIVHTCQKPGG